MKRPFYIAFVFVTIVALSPLNTVQAETNNSRSFLASVVCSFRSLIGAPCEDTTPVSSDTTNLVPKTDQTPQSSRTQNSTNSSPNSVSSPSTNTASPSVSSPSSSRSPVSVSPSYLSKDEVRSMIASALSSYKSQVSQAPAPQIIYRSSGSTSGLGDSVSRGFATLEDRIKSGELAISNGTFSAATISSGTAALSTLTMTGDIDVAATASYKQDGKQVLKTSVSLLNTFVGADAGLGNTTGNGNTGVGYTALTNVTTGIQNVGVGAQALTANTTGIRNVALGFASLVSATTASRNTGLGHGALAGTVTGENNTAVGYLSMLGNSTGTENAAVGTYTLYNSKTGSYNSTLGSYTLQNNMSATNTVAIGYGAGNGVSGQTYSQNNVFLGYLSGYSNTTGNNNTLLGYQSGYNISSGSSNIIIGQNVDAPSATSDRQLNIGNLIYGTNVYNGSSISATPIVGSVGISTTTPWGQLSVNPNGITGPSFVIGSTTKTDFIVTNGGSVGIGTANPTSALTITGDVNTSRTLEIHNNYAVGIDMYSHADASWRGPIMNMFRSGGTQSAPTVLPSSGGQLGYLEFYGYDGDSYDLAAMIMVNFLPSWSTTSHPTDMLFTTTPVGGTSGQTRLNLTSSGDVYMGGTIATNYSGATMSMVSNKVGIGSSTPWGLLSVNPTALGSGVPEFVVGSSTATHFLVNGTGYVGIGTVTPDNLLTVAGSAKISAGIANDSEASLKIFDGNYGFSVGTANDLNFWAADDFIFNSGSVGIGLSSPGYKLDVVGNASTSADSYFNGHRFGRGNSTDATSLAVGFGTINTSNTAPGNTAVGYQALPTVTGSYNTAVGMYSQYSATTAILNTSLGYQSLSSNSIGQFNVAIGMSAGKYETGSNSFYVNNQDQGDTAHDKTDSLLYGTFNATPASQTLTINASTSIAQNLQVLGTGNSYFAGNVGIGTTSPAKKFDIYGGSVSPGTFNTYINIGNVVTGGASNTNTGLGSIDWAYDVNNPVARITGIWERPNTLHVGALGFYTNDHNGISEKMRITSAGNVGLSTTTPSQTLSVQGNTLISGNITSVANITATGTISASNLLGGATTLSTDVNGNIIRTPSDISLKENIVPLTNSLEKLLKLQGVSYDWKDKERFGSSKEIGLIAQEVETVVPEVVKGGSYKSLNYGNLVALVVEAVKELSTKLDTLASSLKDLVVNSLSAEIIYVKNGEADVFKINTKLITQGDVCVDEVCVTKDQFKSMLMQNGATVYSSALEAASNGVPQTTIPDTNIETSSSTTPTASTTEPVSTQTIQPEVSTPEVMTETSGGAPAETSPKVPIETPTTEIPAESQVSPAI